MPAIASLEDLRAAQEEKLSIHTMPSTLPVLRSAAGHDVGGCGVLIRWRNIGWKNICKLWLEESTPEQLKGESQ